jgi:HlyD family secretion protein
MMDRSIEQQVLAGRKKKLLMYILIGILLLIGVILLLRTVFSATLKQSQITTAIVEKGDIENTVNASGEVLPEF